MKQIPLYKFYKEKYHKELLMDVVDIAFIRPWLKKTPVYRDNFYRIVFITEGEGVVSVDGHKKNVEQGCMICSIPGEVWNWQQNSDMLNGYVLLFEKEFLSSFFNDPLFLEKFPYLNPKRVSPFLILDKVLYEQIRLLIVLAKEEINKRQDIDPHFLRAMLYGILTLMERARSTGNGTVQSNELSANRHIERFTRLVNEHFASEHDAEFYAGELCVTTNYLNKIVKASLGTTTKLYIQARIMSEARKLLSYTSMSVSEIADVLHFNTSSYFIRFFTRQAGVTPLQFRNADSPEKVIFPASFVFCLSA